MSGVVHTLVDVGDTLLETTKLNLKLGEYDLTF